VADPSKRSITIVLVLGIIVLVAGIALGEREGNRVIGQVTEKRIQSIAPVTVTPAPLQTGANPYGPDWKRTDVMSAAPDPQFPDPRVPPVAPPTPTPTPKFTAPAVERPTPTPTPNMNVPIWRRYAPLPTVTPSGQPTPGATPAVSPAGAQATASPKP
jgi:hypothetical protein